MLRGIVVLLVAFFTLAAAQPKEAAREPAGKADQNVAAALENVATALNLDDEAPQHQQPCKPGENKRSSDLCSQWNAADAAKLAADVALWAAIVGSVLGAATLVAATAAAIFAGRAVSEAKRGANADEKALVTTREVAAAELRPWVVIEPRVQEFKADEVGFDLRYKVVFRNVGQTAARDIVINFTPIFWGGSVTEKIEELWTEWKDLKADFKRTLMPDEEHSGMGSISNTTRTLPWIEWGKKGPRKIMCVIVAAIRYQSVMDGQWHRTERSFCIGMKGGKGLFDDQYLPETLRGEWNAEAFSEKFVISQFYAGETA